MNKNYIILALVFLLGITSAYAIKNNVHIIILGKGEITDFIEKIRNNGKEPVFDKVVAGKTAPAFTLTAENGQLKLDDYKGKLVLLNFWASWCPPCRAEMPGFIKTQEKYKDKPFTFIGVAIEDKEAVLAYAKEIEVNYPITYGIEEAYKVVSDYGNPDGALPYSVLISPEQKIIEVFSGFLSEDRLEELISKNLPSS